MDTNIFNSGNDKENDLKESFQKTTQPTNKEFPVLMNLGTVFPIPSVYVPQKLFRFINKAEFEQLVNLLKILQSNGLYASMYFCYLQSGANPLDIKSELPILMFTAENVPIPKNNVHIFIDIHRKGNIVARIHVINSSIIAQIANYKSWCDFSFCNVQQIPSNNFDSFCKSLKSQV